MLTFKSDSIFEQSIKELAEYEGLTVSALIRNAIREYIHSKVVSAHEAANNSLFVVKTLADAVEGGEVEFIKNLCASLNVDPVTGILPKIAETIENCKRFQAETNVYVKTGRAIEGIGNEAVKATA